VACFIYTRLDIRLDIFLYLVFVNIKVKIICNLFSQINMCTYEYLMLIYVFIFETSCGFEIEIWLGMSTQHKMLIK